MNTNPKGKSSVSVFLLHGLWSLLVLPIRVYSCPLVVKRRGPLRQTRLGSAEAAAIGRGPLGACPRLPPLASHHRGLLRGHGRAGWLAHSVAVSNLLRAGGAEELRFPSHCPRRQRRWGQCQSHFLLRVCRQRFPASVMQIKLRNGNPYELYPWPGRSVGEVHSRCAHDEIMPDC
jgi:hypothetical protein